jgi:sigma-B regulation protein RsbU (phosphoserine phosphatase)
METGEVAWVADVWADQQFPRQGMDTKIKGALGLPVKVAGNVVAVLEFFSDEPMQPDDNMIRILTNVANQLSRVFERRHTEAQLAQQSAALGAANEGIGITDIDGTFTWINPAFTKLTGYSAAEVIGQNPRVLKSGAHDEQFYHEMWRTILSGEVWVGEVINRAKDGRLYTEEQSITPIRDDRGKIVNFVAIKRDITDRKLMEEELEIARLRMEDELNVGREIQMSMLPLKFPAFPDRSDFSVHAGLEPAREVGGDFYDFFLTDDGRFCFCVGDVSGKGVPSALFMAVTKTLINSRGQFDASPGSIMSHVNAEMGRHNEACMFVTIFLGILDLKTGELWYTNAGHNPPYLIQRGEPVRLDQRHGPVVGAADGIEYGEDMVTLAPSDQLLVYSDGVTEAMNEDQQLYSEGRLAEVLAATRFKTVEDVVDSVMTDVWRFQGSAEQADDVTVLAVAFNGNGTKTMPHTLELTIVNQLAEIDRVNQAFRGFAGEHGIPFSKPPWSVMFDELLNNIISYGFDDDREHAIDIRVVIDETRVTVTIADDGIPFDPFSIAEPDTTLPVEERGVGGLGIHLVRNLMDEVSYERVEGRNVVTLVTHRPTDAT